MIPTELRSNFNITFEIEDTASLVPTGFTPKFILGGSTSFTKSGTVDGDNIKFELLPTDTATLATGQYWYQVVAEDGSSRVFIKDGTVWVIGQITGAGTYDGRSVAEKILEAIDAAMLGKATRDQQSYIIQSGSGSRSLVRLNIAELKQVRSYYAGLVAAEKRLASDQAAFKRHKFTFVAD